MMNRNNMALSKDLPRQIDLSRLLLEFQTSLIVLILMNLHSRDSLCLQSFFKTSSTVDSLYPACKLWWQGREMSTREKNGCLELLSVALKLLVLLWPCEADHSLSLSVVVKRQAHLYAPHSVHGSLAQHTHWHSSPGVAQLQKHKPMIEDQSAVHESF